MSSRLIGDGPTCGLTGKRGCFYECNYLIATVGNDESLEESEQESRKGQEVCICHVIAILMVMPNKRRYSLKKERMIFIHGRTRICEGSCIRLLAVRVITLSKALQ